MESLEANAAGGPICLHVPVFSADSKLLFAGTVGGVKVYVVSSGSLLSFLPAENAREPVLAVCLHPADKNLIFGFDKTGAVTIWNYREGILLRSVQLKIVGELASVSLNGESFYFISQETINGKIGRPKRLVSALVELSFSVKTFKPRSRILFKKRGSMLLASDPRQQRLVVAVKDKVAVVDLEKLQKPAKFDWKFSQEITAIVVHPVEPCVAVGDRLGRISLWYILDHPPMASLPSSPSVDNLRPLCTSFHWHAHAVTSLCFTSLLSGAYLISGGNESVLVLWQLATGEKSFLPRLGLKIQGISVSPDEGLIVAGTADNALHVISALNFQRLSIIQGLVKPSTADINSNVILERSIRTGGLLTQGLDGTLQIYDARKDCSVGLIEVVQQQALLADESARNAVVTHAKVSHDGEWLVTVDSRCIEDKYSRSCTLRFWKFEDKSQSYVMNTVIDDPHGNNALINDLQFSPTSDFAITSSQDDCRFKKWEIVLNSSVTKLRPGAESRASWRLASAGGYREEKPRSATISTDGSILAIAFDKVVTIWDPTTFAMHRTLVVASSKQGIQSTRFVGNEGLLLVMTFTHLQLWDLLSASLVWAFHTVSEMVAVGSDSKFAVLLKSKKPLASSGVSASILMFEGKSAQPTASYHVEDSKGVKAMVFDEENTLAFINDNGQIMRLAEKSQPIKVSNASAVSKAIDSQSSYLRLVGNAQVQVLPAVPVSGKPVEKRHAIRGSLGEWEKMEKAMLPSHMIPKVGILFEMLAESSLPKSRVARDASVLPDESLINRNEAGDSEMSE